MKTILKTAALFCLLPLPVSGFGIPGVTGSDGPATVPPPPSVVLDREVGLGYAINPEGTAVTRGPVYSTVPGLPLGGQDTPGPREFDRPSYRAPGDAGLELDPDVIDLRGFEDLYAPVTDASEAPIVLQPPGVTYPDWDETFIFDVTTPDATGVDITIDYNADTGLPFFYYIPDFAFYDNDGALMGVLSRLGPWRTARSSVPFDYTPLPPGALEGGTSTSALGTNDLDATSVCGFAVCSYMANVAFLDGELSHIVMALNRVGTPARSVINPPDVFDPNMEVAGPLPETNGVMTGIASVSIELIRLTDEARAAIVAPPAEDVDFAPVPVPPAMAGLLVGIGALALLRRRRS